MKHKTPHSRIGLAVLITLMVVIPVAKVAHGEPPFSFPNFPGSKMGEVEARWIAPFVCWSSYSVGGHIEAVVRWYDGDGNIVKEVSGRRISASDECVVELTESETVVHGVSGLWQIILPGKDSPDAGIHPPKAKEDIFVSQYYKTKAELAVDVYSHGKLVGSAGPFPQGWDPARLHENGCTSFTTGERYKKAPRQVVVIGPDAKIRLQQNIGDDDIFPFPVANGKGVLLEVDGLKRPPVRFHYVRADGTNSILDMPANAQPLYSVKSSDLVVFSTGSEDQRLQLVDTLSGKIVWDIAAPVRRSPIMPTHLIVADDKVFLLGIDAAAVDLNSGKIIAVWRQESPHTTVGGFFRKGNELFIVTDKEFFKLNPADVDAKRNGWQ